VVRHDVVLADAQLEIEDVQEFALDPADIALAKDACAHSPVHVLERGVIEILAGGDKCAKEDPLVGPLFECDVEMGFGPVKIDECGQDGGYFYFGSDEDVVNHGCKCRSFVSSRDGAATAGMRRTVEGKVDSLDDGVNQVFDDGTGKLLVDEVEESLGVGRGLDQAGFVDGGVVVIVHHCV